MLDFKPEKREFGNLINLTYIIYFDKLVTTIKLLIWSIINVYYDKVSKN